jgi:hypothetical protein
MTYKFKTHLLLSFLFLLFSSIQAYSQLPDTSYLVPNSPLLAKLIYTKDLNTTVFLSNESVIIPLKGTYLAGNGQKIIKQGDDIFILIQQTGFVYKLTTYDSSTCLFMRIDHTINLNYNIDCKNFIYKGQLYSFGGYGFWKSNGHLRKFSFEDSEWDIIPLSEEIMSSNYSWFDPKAGRLYVPLQRVVNAGVIGAENVKGIPLLTSYYLDLEKKQWFQLGELNSDLVKNLQMDMNASGFLSIEEGLLHLIHDEAYLFDFRNNRVLKSRNADFNQFLIRRAGLTNMFIYKGYIYSYNESTKSFSLYPIKLSEFEILSTHIWGNEKRIMKIAIVIVSIILFIAILIWILNRLVKRKIEVAQLKIIKSKSANQTFSATEEALIQLILAASVKGDTVDIHQINHVLGIKDKNIGLQKKVRSDVMNAINDKYEFIAQSNEILIGSSRKEDDKRFFEYFINPKEVKTIQRILAND